MNRLGAFHRRALYWVYGMLLLTGSFWALLHYLPGYLHLDEHASMAGSAWLMKLHGAAAMLALVLIGWLMPRHITGGLRRSINKKTGCGMLIATVLLVATGYLLYYAGSEQLRQASSIAHLAAGMVLPVLASVHLLHLLPHQTGVWRRASE